MEHFTQKSLRSPGRYEYFLLPLISISLSVKLVTLKQTVQTVYNFETGTRIHERGRLKWYSKPCKLGTVKKDVGVATLTDICVLHSLRHGS